MYPLSWLDRLILEADTALRTLLPPAQRISQRQSPAHLVREVTLSEQEKKHVAGLMRVNHAGEVCAQALYQGQALTARLTHIKKQMQEAAAEETDHLAWCEERLQQLQAKSSRLNPLWYAGSLFLGALAGLAGDRISLGFVAETERQVMAHLQKHVHALPSHDKKTAAILQRMQEDEEYHAQTAMNAGAAILPDVIKRMMAMMAKLMTTSSYYW